MIFIVLINLVAGGAGFLGSHLIDKLISKGQTVICLDNLITGSEENIKHCYSNNKFKFILHDITKPLFIENIDRIWNLACPASPFQYQRIPLETLKTCFQGTYNLLELANKNDAKILHASTSEIYGNPEIHPQNELYNGSVNPIGKRSCYDEGKRIAETLCFDFHRQFKTDFSLVRIFNTYGPRMLPNDGRVISNFICQSLLNKSITVFGDGSQTRSFCFVDDLIDGLILSMNSNYNGPINLGNEKEYKIIEIAEIIKDKINLHNNIVFKELPQDDPVKRKPDISLAKEKIDWVAKTTLDQGIDKTINYFKKIIN